MSYVRLAGLEFAAMLLPQTPSAGSTILESNVTNAQSVVPVLFVMAKDKTYKTILFNESLA